MLRRKNKRFIELITMRDNINNALGEENRELKKSQTESGLVIIHLQKKLESQQKRGLDEALNQGVKEIELEEQKLNRKMENMRDSLKKRRKVIISC